VCEDWRMATGGTDPRRSRRRWWLAGAGIVVLAVLGVGLWVAWKGSVAYVGLRDAQDSASKARAAVGKGDAHEASRQLTAMTDSLGRARGATQDSVWTATSSVPWIGANLQAVTSLTAALDDLARDGVAPVIDVATVVASGGLAPVDGRIDLGPLAAAAPELARAADAGDRAHVSLAEIDD